MMHPMTMKLISSYDEEVTAAMDWYEETGDGVMVVADALDKEPPNLGSLPDEVQDIIQRLAWVGLAHTALKVAERKADRKEGG